MALVSHGRFLDNHRMNVWTHLRMFKNSNFILRMLNSTKDRARGREGCTYHYRPWTSSIKPSLQHFAILLFWVFFMGFIILYSSIDLLLYLCYIWPFGINDYNTFSVEIWIPLRPVLVRLRDAAIFILSWTHSIKMSLQLS